jgi:tRNA(Ile)-lysidine synthase
VSHLLDHVEQSILARRLLRPRQRILVAVSGGADSMVLLHVLHDLARKHEWRLTVAHLNHRLRGRSSDADEELVRCAAGRLKLPVVAEAADVRELARANRLSLEMAARKLRHDFLARTASRRRIPVIALAHHADDQLELFFLRLFRGGGGEGLAGMKWRNPSPSDRQVQLVRPLLDQPKVVLCEYAAEQRIRFREDATNALLDFQRNRIRHELLPLLRRKYQPALNRTISRVMDIVGAEAEFAAEAAEKWLHWAVGPKPKRARASLAGRFRGQQEGEWKQSLFGDLPVAVQRRCVQLQLRRQGVEPDFELVEQLRVSAGRVVTLSQAQAPGKSKACKGGKSPAARAALRGERWVRARYAVRNRSGILYIKVATPEEFCASSAVADLVGKAGEIEFDGARISWRVASRKAAARDRAGVRQESFDADKVGSRVRLRHWKPGDRFQPIGMPCAVKLQDIFTNQKIPRHRRRQLVVAATNQGEVFWVEGIRISERFKLTGRTIRRLQWRWERL